MVRVLVLALLLANLLFFGWSQWIDVPAPPARSSIAGLPRLTLVRDLLPDQRAGLARKMALQTLPPKCVSVGPFDDLGVASRAAALLQAKSLVPRQRIVQAPAVRRFWVYLDGFAGDAGVTRVLHTLEHGGIDDAEAMTPNAGGRQISLGLFSDRAHAEVRAQAVRKMGLKPRVEERTVPGTIYWLDLTLPNSSVAVPLKDVSNLEPGGGTAPISVQQCPSAAAPATPTTPAGTGTPAPQPAVPGAAPAASPASARAHRPILPLCKPGGGGPVPCVAPEARDVAHPSVF